MTVRTPGEGRYAHTEREQRWLLSRIPEGASRAVEIEDRYIIGTRLRLRTVRDGATTSHKLGQKVRTGASPEVVRITNIYLDDEERQALAVLPADEVVKRRWKVTVDEGEIAVDEFRGSLDGLVLGEVELPVDHPRLAMPDFAVADVTDDERFAGGTLARTTEQALREAIADVLTST